jgi:co-chaperonin GroES (HSP10)
MKHKNYQVFGNRVIVEVEPEHDTAPGILVGLPYPFPFQEPAAEEADAPKLAPKPFFGGVRLSRGRVVAVGERPDNRCEMRGLDEVEHPRSRKRRNPPRSDRKEFIREMISAISPFALGNDKVGVIPDEVDCGDIILFDASRGTMQVPEDEALRVVPASAIVAVLAPHRIPGISDTATAHMFEQTLRTIAEQLDTVEDINKVKALARLARLTVDGYEADIHSPVYGEDN